MGKRVIQIFGDRWSPGLLALQKDPTKLIVTLHRVRITAGEKHFACY